MEGEAAEGGGGDLLRGGGDAIFSVPNFRCKRTGAVTYKGSGEGAERRASFPTYRLTALRNPA